MAPGVVYTWRLSIRICRSAAATAASIDGRFVRLAITSPRPFERGATCTEFSYFINVSDSLLILGCVYIDEGMSKKDFCS